MAQKHGTFVVTHADEATAILQDVSDGQIHALQGNPDLEPGSVIEATLEPVPPTDAAWQVADLESRREVRIERSDEPPTSHECEVGSEQAIGDLTRIERAGTGELHVITVPADGVEDAISDVLADETGLVSRAARLGVNRVEVRATDDSVETEAVDDPCGVLSVRYLP